MLKCVMLHVINFRALQNKRSSFQLSQLDLNDNYFLLLVNNDDGYNDYYYNININN